MDKKGKHALSSESALHKSLACKNYSSSASKELCRSLLNIKEWRVPDYTANLLSILINIESRVMQIQATSEHCGTQL